jgi:methionyl-tRNA synthetase
VNPMLPEWHDMYVQVHAELVEDLVHRGEAIRIVEKYLFNERTGEDLLGFRLSGECPACSSATVGLVCENCGLQVTSDMLKGTKLLTQPHVVWKDGETLALRIADRATLRSYIDTASVPVEFKQVMAAFLDEENIIRLTEIGGHSVGQVCINDFVYNLYNTYFGHALFCGQVYSDLYGDPVNPFSKASNVTTVTSCGLDNATDLTASLAYAAVSPLYKGFDYSLGNFFLNLEGLKFSTSRGHAVFVSDVRASPEINVDALRLYLALISPQNQVTNFDVQSFVEFHNEWFVARLSTNINRAWRKLNGSCPLSASSYTLKTLDAAISTREDALQLGQFDLCLYAELIISYANQSVEFSNATDAYWWLKTFAVLASPLMPQFSQNVWGAVGHEGDPSREQFSTVTEPASNHAALTMTHAISRDEFRWETNAHH